MTQDAMSNDNGPRLRKSDVTRQRILDAAAEIFRVKGYTAARLSDIADAAATQAGSLYYHFESKEQLAEAVLEIGVERVSNAVARATASLPANALFRLRLKAAIEAHLSNILQHDNYSAANVRIINQVPEEVRERHLEQHRQYGAFWREFLRSAQAAGDIRTDADLSALRMLLLGALNWSVEWYRPGRLSASEIAVELTEMVLRGVGTADADGPG